MIEGKLKEGCLPNPPCRDPSPGATGVMLRCAACMHELEVNAALGRNMGEKSVVERATELSTGNAP